MTQIAEFIHKLRSQNIQLTKNLQNAETKLNNIDQKHNEILEWET